MSTINFLFHARTCSAVRSTRAGAVGRGVSEAGAVGRGAGAGATGTAGPGAGTRSEVGDFAVSEMVRFPHVT